MTSNTILRALACLAVAGCSDGAVIGAVVAEPPPPPPPPVADAGVAPEPPPCAVACSADGRSIVDCRGTAVETCDASTSCVPFEGKPTCASACQRAGATMSTRGCEFLVPAPRSSCLALFVANVSDEPARIEAEKARPRVLETGQTNVPKLMKSSASYRLVRRDGVGTEYELIEGGELAPHTSAVMFLAGNGCPPVKVLDAEGRAFAPTQRDLSTGTGFLQPIGNPFRIKSTAPIVAVALDSYNEPSGATPVHPVHTLGTSHAIVAPHVGDSGDLPFTLSLAPNVKEQRFGVDLPGTALLTAETLVGEFINVYTAGDPSGGSVRGTAKAAAFVEGCASSPSTTGPCERAVQQLPQRDAWGSEYVVVPHRPSAKSTGGAVVRLHGLANGTQLVYEPSAPPGAPSALAAGQIVEFTSTSPFVVRAQNLAHRFALAQLRVAAAEAWTDPSDYFFGLPTRQFIEGEIPFFVHPDSEDAEVVIVRARDAASLAEVALDCAGVVGRFQPIGTAGRYEVARTSLRIHGKPAGACDAGPHRLWSTGPVGVTVWASTVGEQVRSSYVYNPAQRLSLTAEEGGR